LVASDPHLDYSVPGPWYLTELQAQGLHVAGATLAGTPGVLIGHNDRLAWGVTSGTVSTVTVYREPLRDVRVVAREKIAIRFGPSALFEAKQTRHGFVFAEDARYAYAAQWSMDRSARSPLGAFLALDRASSLEEGLRALARFPGPILNFTLGERSGRVAYHMAGMIPIDDAWSRYVEDGVRVKDAWRGYVPFDRLPHVDPSRDAIVFSANNRTYGADYPYRLAEHFMPPYRARRIHDLLFSGKLMDVEAMRRLQMDDLSLPEREFARGVAAWLASKKDLTQEERIAIWALKNWDGRMQPASREAALAYRLREAAASRYAALILGEKLGPAWRANVGESEATASMLCALRTHAVEYGTLLDRQALKGAATSWGEAGTVALHHPLHGLFISLFDPPPFAGSGDFASVKVQTRKHGQGLRAVWDVGRWDRGGAILQLGESGRPGRHYDDEQTAFVAGELLPLEHFTGRAP
jgi:penicillin G amidase